MKEQKKITNNTATSKTPRNSLKRYKKIFTISCFAIIFILSFLFATQCYKPITFTNQEEKFCTDIVSDIWFKGLNSLDSENVKQIVLDITDPKITENDIVKLYNNGLSALDYNSIELTIQYKNFYIHQRGNIFKLMHYGNKENITIHHEVLKITYSNNILTTNTIFDILPYYVCIIGFTLIGGVIGCLLLSCIYTFLSSKLCKRSKT